MLVVTGHDEGEDNVPGDQSADGSSRGEVEVGDGDSDRDIPSVMLATVCKGIMACTVRDQSLSDSVVLLPSFTGRTRTQEMQAGLIKRKTLPWRY